MNSSLPANVTLLSTSISNSRLASLKYTGACAVLAKRESDGLTVVIKAAYPNRRLRFYRYGYCRFAKPPVWLQKAAEIPGNAHQVTSHAAWHDLKIVEHVVSVAISAADEVTALNERTK
jgi:hypothetical protein